MDARIPAAEAQHFLPGMGFAGPGLDRAEHLRRDDAAINGFLADPASRWMTFLNLKPVLAAPPALAIDWQPGAALLAAGIDTAAAMTAGRAVFLGLDPAGLAHFAIALAGDDPAARALNGREADPRGAAMQLAGPDAAALAHARALLAWHGAHGFCAACGTASAAHKAGLGRKCTNTGCGAEHFPRVDPVVIMLVTDGERCLLGRQPMFPPGMYSALAGFVEPGETLEQAVAREVFEEAGLRVGTVHYFASQPWPFPSSLMIGCIAQATTLEISIDTEELEEARWFSRAECRKVLQDQASGKPASPAASFMMPPAVAIAHHLVKAWAMGG